MAASEVCAGYGREPVLRGVSLDVHPGDRVALVGPNGSGKSSLIRALSGALPLQQGRVVVEGRPLLEWPQKQLARVVAVVSQSETPAFAFTVRDVVMMGRYAHLANGRTERSHDYEVAEGAMAATDVLHLASRVVTELSGGEYQRVILARALAQQPRILLLDEPTAHLDLAHQADILSLVRRQSVELGLAVVMAVHELGLAAEYCDTLLWMADGAVAAQGTPEETINAETIRLVYRAEVTVAANPITGKPMIASSRRIEPIDRRSVKVHLICGGGSGLEWVRGMLRAGATVSVGVVNQFDTDEAAAQALSLEAAVEAPFSAVSDDAAALCRKLMFAAELIMVAAAPFGHGNVRNLELALDAQAHGIPVAIAEAGPDLARDFTGGIATGLLERLRERGASTVSTVAELLDVLPCSG
ncbi:MAG: ABC transporter ATP-binding protein [Armatimonadetes bacterium]|nr:ABC transporter ATP-binding protein [Armatimonadota bacterium]